MERIFILGDINILSGLAIGFEEIPDNLRSDIEMHDWVVSIFNSYDFDKLVISFTENPIVALKLAFHIRLSIQELFGKVLIPIVLIGDISFQQLFLQAKSWSCILYTKGITYIEQRSIFIIEEIKALEGLREIEYRTTFLNLITVLTDETIGRHSLANIWGAWAMARAANLNMSKINFNTQLTKTLSFKYSSSFLNLSKLSQSTLKVVGNIYVGGVKSINAIGKRILYIDDESDKGWENVLRNIFKTSSDSDFVVINETVKNTEALSKNAKNIIDNQNFDLYLIDLRLNGLNEDEEIDVELLSGNAIYRYIKKLNKGNQVIVFSASNKIWSLQKLLTSDDEGIKIDGYYLKESVHYGFSKQMSDKHHVSFEQSVIKCFNRGYLKNLYEIFKKIEKNTKSQALKYTLNMAWELLDLNYKHFAFFILYQSIEQAIKDRFIYIREFDEWTFNGKTVWTKIENKEVETVLQLINNPRDVDYFIYKSNITKEFIPSTLFFISCFLILQMNKDEDYLKIFAKKNKLRNDIAHKMDKAVVEDDDLKFILYLLKELIDEKLFE
jgi:hypothetical protein